ncbi:Peroxisome biosynthesis protein pex1 [Mucor velutinosus]|uniref:60S ribosomal protein L36 n=1 Tax=Mucor velutinosus TaxID=708070 RepID=A0AAN7DRA4_9FUNG|nr:Peroxisome biosynthesis protein pex1 [Mucor velutinosus]
MAASGIAVGINKGHIVTRRVLKAKPSNKIGAASKRATFVRSIVREVSGYAPYERRVMELIKNSRDKRARKLCKAKLGTFLRAKKKIEELSGVIASSRRH